MSASERKAWTAASNRRERQRERESDRERALLCKVITLTSNQLYVESCSNVIYLLCTAKGQGLKGSLKGSV